MDLNETIGFNIRRLRKARGWTQQNLADRYAALGDGTCNLKYISLLETGRKWFGRNAFHNFMKVFGVPADELIRYQPKDNIYSFIAGKVTHIMEGSEREKFIEVVDVFLNHHVLHPDVWENFIRHLDSMFAFVHKKTVEIAEKKESGGGVGVTPH